MAANGKPLTKTQLFDAIAEQTDLSRKQVGEVFEAFTDVCGQQLSKRGPGSLMIPGLLKIIRHKKPAMPARKNVRLPNGDVKDLPPKPAQTVVKVRALKALKDMV